MSNNQNYLDVIIDPLEYEDILEFFDNSDYYYEKYNSEFHCFRLPVEDQYEADNLELELRPLLAKFHVMFEYE